MRHRAKRRNTGAGTNKKQVAFDRFGQNKYTLRSSQRQFMPYFHLIKKIGGAGATFQQNDHQFKNIGAIGPGSNGITAPPLSGFFMNRQVERYKLAGFEIE